MNIDNISFLIKKSDFSCRALGARLWCKECIVDPKALLLSICDYYRERRLLAQLNDKCRKCLCKLQFPNQQFLCNGHYFLLALIKSCKKQFFNMYIIPVDHSVVEFSMVCEVLSSFVNFCSIM